MTVIIQHTCAWLSSSSDPEGQPELLTAFWEMCHRCLVFQPGLLLSLPCAPQLFEAAISCVRHQEFQHTVRHADQRRKHARARRLGPPPLASCSIC